jgi:hypothetical protein
MSSLLSEISTKAATALATTVGLWSAKRSLQIHQLDTLAPPSYVPEHRNKSFLLDSPLAVVRRIQLGNPATYISSWPSEKTACGSYARDGCRLPDIWILILQRVPQRIDERLDNLRQRDRRHGPYSQRSDQGVPVGTILVQISRFPTTLFERGLTERNPEMAAVTSSGLARP